MKKVLIIVIILALILAVFLFNANLMDVDENHITNNYNTTDNTNDLEEESDLIGVWCYYNYDKDTNEPISIEVASFDKIGELNRIWLSIDNATVYDYEKCFFEDLGNNTAKINFGDEGRSSEIIEFYIEEKEVPIKYPDEYIKDSNYEESIFLTNLYFGDRTFIRCKDTIFDDEKSIVGIWQPVNEWTPPFSFVDLYAEMDTLEFYTDDSLCLRTIYGGIESAEYRFIHDGKYIEITYGVDSGIYEYELIGDSLMLLSCAGKDDKSSNLNEMFCLLEQIA